VLCKECGQVLFCIVVVVDIVMIGVEMIGMLEHVSDIIPFLVKVLDVGISKRNQGDTNG
jgi:hypothetical protein